MEDIDERCANVGDLVVPGAVVGLLGKHVAGEYVFSSGSALHATTVGLLREERLQGALSRRIAPAAPLAMPHLPTVGSVVTARVVKVTPRGAHCELLVCDGVPLSSAFKGTIRKKDVRQTEIDKVVIYNCFRPGDVVSALIVSLGDKHAYFLSTAQNEYGVLRALGPTGEPMVPLSWVKMECPLTKTVHARKVAYRAPEESSGSGM